MPQSRRGAGSDTHTPLLSRHWDPASPVIGVEGAGATGSGRRAGIFFESASR